MLCLLSSSRMWDPLCLTNNYQISTIIEFMHKQSFTKVHRIIKLENTFKPSLIICLQESNLKLLQKTDGQPLFKYIQWRRTTSPDNWFHYSSVRNCSSCNLRSLFYFLHTRTIDKRSWPFYRRRYLKNAIISTLQSFLKTKNITFLSLYS